MLAGARRPFVRFGLGAFAEARCSESLQAASRAPLTSNNRVCFVFMVEVIFEAIIYFDLPFDDCSVESNGRLFAA